MTKTKRAPKRRSRPDLSYIAEELRPLAEPIESLELDPENARKHPDNNRAATRASLLSRGQVLPITVRLANNVVMTGNMTVELALELGWTHIAAIFLDYSEEQAAAWAIAHNLGASLALWDDDQLAKTLREYQDAIDWGDVGFEADYLEELLADPAPVGEDPSSGEPEEPPIPDPPAEPITQRGEVIELGPHVLHCADCMDVLRSLPDNSVDAIVTDPPYGLSPDGRARTWDDIEALRAEGKGPTGGFMGRAWDAGVPGVTWARECLRVLKPGGYLVAFSASRTIHRLTCSVEDAGFEIREGTFGWLQWQGFPKSLDVSKAIDKLHGVEREVIGKGINFDAKVRHSATHDGENTATYFGAPSGPMITAPATPDAKTWSGWGTGMKPAIEPAVIARKPLSEQTVAANVLRWGTGALNIDACRYAYGDTAWPGPDNAMTGDKDRASGTPRRTDNTKYGKSNPEINPASDIGRWPANIYACPKPSTRERNAGAEDVGVAHETVKPRRLFAWLLRLVTPPGGTVVEPFGGSGTTLVAACGLDCKVIAAEREPGYCDIIRARVEWALDREPAPE